MHSRSNRSLRWQFCQAKAETRKTEKLKLRMAIMPEIETRFSVVADQAAEEED